MKGIRVHVRSILMASVAGIASIPLAHAQDASDNEIGIEPIVITAQKRAEPLQDVPISVSVLGGDRLEASGIADIKDIARSVPGMSFDNALPGRSHVSIRGIVAASGDPTVGVYIDEYPVPSGQGGGAFIGSTDVRLWDVERVEVLRGPQGTLYGAGSMGGTIRFITPAPSLTEFSGRAQAALSTTSHTETSLNYRAAAALGGPLVNGSLGVRVSAFYERQAGFIDQVDANGDLLKKNADDLPAFGVRATMLWEPGGDWKISPSIYYQETRAGSDPSYSSILPGFQKIARIDEKITDRFFMPALTVEKSFGGVDIVSATSYFDRKLELYTDYTDIDLNSLAGTLQSAEAALPFRNTVSTNMSRSRIKTFTQEVRLSSAESDASLRWQVGGFYSHIKRRLYQTVEDPNFNAIAASQELSFNAYNDWIFMGLTDRIQDSYAIFADVSYDVADKLTASVGGRVFKMKNKLSRTNGGFFGGGVPKRLIDLFSSEDGFNPKVTLDYKPTQNSLFYATASKGFRAGAPNSPLPTNNACITAALAGLGLSEAPAMYSSDSLWNYEIGTKNTLFGNRMVLNSALYYIDWSNIPQGVPLVSPTGQSCGYSFTGNVGKSSVRGAELETEIRVNRTLTISGNLGYTDAQVEANAPSAGAVKGERLQAVPRWSYGAAIDYRQPLSSGLTVTARVDYVGRSSARRNFNEAQLNYYQEGYDQTNARLGLEGDAWSAELFVQNLFDRAPVLNNDIRLNTTNVYQGYQSYTTLRPRTVGLKLGYEF